MKARIGLVALVAVVVGALSLATARPAAAQQPPQQGTATLVTITDAPVTGTGVNAGKTGLFDGTFRVTGFSAQGGQLLVTGVLNGLVTFTDGTTQTITNQVVTTTATVAQASCRILELDLGPLHLDVLGLVIDLSAVHLDITAQRGPGNLLGNLLCAIAGLLDGGLPTGTALNQLVNLLNQLLGLLG
jgi:hypothetical protein